MSLNKPKRTLGISLAIALSILIFSVVPLLQLGFYWFVSRQIQLNEDGSFGGVEVLGVADQQLAGQAFIAAIFLLIGIFAWRGRPPFVRILFSGSVALLAAGTIIFTILPLLTSQPNLAEGIDSTFQAGRQLRTIQLAAITLTMIYVLWYMNRWPARAYYRGYYLPEELALLEDKLPQK